MTEPPLEPPAGNRQFPHMRVPRRGRDVDYNGRGGARPSRLHAIASRRGHADTLKQELEHAQDQARAAYLALPSQLRPDGVTLCIESWSDGPGYELALQSLDANGAVLLSVMPASDARPQRALVWMPFDVTGKFLRKLEEFATQNTTGGRPKNERLVANIRSIERAILQHLWQETEPFPEGAEGRWWELWLARVPEAPEPKEQLRLAAAELAVRIAPQALTYRDRTIAMAYGTAVDLGRLLVTNCVIAELHRPLSVTEVFGVDPDTRVQLMTDLVRRIEPAELSAPAVCLLDTGIMAGHRILKDSVDGTYTVLTGTTSADMHGHGTGMAGLSLLGDLRHSIACNGLIRLTHRLESVKVVEPGNPDAIIEPPLYGAVTASAAAQVEIDNAYRSRVFSMPVTAVGAASTGRPSSWSVSMDALAFGTYIESNDFGVDLIENPESSERRLFLVSAGNVLPRVNIDGLPDYILECDAERVEDPGQAWNVLTVGAFTEITELPTDPVYRGWKFTAGHGEISPYSRTSVLFDGPWPLKPDILLEGGNSLTNSADTERFQDTAGDLLTTDRNGELGHSNATSAATAQAARLAALVMARYPDWWPETVRGILVHAAAWTKPMRERIFAEKKKGGRATLIRRYGWGVPTEERVLYSAASDVTMIIQDEFQPFMRSGGNVKTRALRLHELPWPREQLLRLHDGAVRMRITLSYFVEPNPSSRGWDVRYRYPSHQLRFDVKRPTETVEEFQIRVSREAQAAEESSVPAQTAPDKRWLLGPDNRHKGSLHADIWEGMAVELAEGSAIAVVPVGGWWKDNRRRDRAELPIRYTLLVSLTSEIPTDIYTPIAAKIGVPVEVMT